MQQDYSIKVSQRGKEVIEVDCLKTTNVLAWVIEESQEDSTLLCKGKKGGSG